MQTSEPLNGASPKDDFFPSTHWSGIFAAGHEDSEKAQTALTSICKKYWQPIYVYIRHRGHGHQDAQDLTQSFFATLLEKNQLKSAQQERGRFRSFILTSVKNFLSNEWDRKTAQKRGGGKVSLLSELDNGEMQYQLESSEDLTPEKHFDRQWARTMMKEVISRLQQEWEKNGKGELFHLLQPFLLGEKPSSYQTIAEASGINEGKIGFLIFQLRRRFRDLLCESVSLTLDQPEEIDSEIRYLAQVLGTEGVEHSVKT